MAKVGTIKAEIKADTGAIREALSKLDITIKQQLALQAALRDIDLDKVIASMDAIWDQLKPLYEKNLEALQVITKEPDYKKNPPYPKGYGPTGKKPHTTIIDDPIGNEAWETCTESLKASRNNRCEKCGVILFDDSELCPECEGGEL